MISFGQQDQQNRRTGRVESRTGRNYIIAADDGSRFPAESEKPWSVNTRVLVVYGIIVGRAGAARTAAVFQV